MAEENGQRVRRSLSDEAKASAVGFDTDRGKTIPQLARAVSPAH